MSDKIRNLIAAIAAISVFGFALGLTFPLLSLLMEKAGISAEVIGYNTAMQPVGILLAGFAIPAAVRNWGARNTAIAASFLAALISLAYPHLPITPWFVLRVIQGFSVSILFSISESWILRFAEGPYRSRIVALYASVLSLSFAGGPVIIAWTGIDSILPFVIGAGVLVLATLPIFALKDSETPAEDGAAATMLSFAPKAPILLTAVFMFALLDAAHLGFLPVYGIRKGMSEEAAALVLTAFVIGNTILQFPIGWIADHFDKRLVMAGCALLTAITTALIPSVAGSWLLWPLIMVMGAVSAGIYLVALSDLGDRFGGGELMAGTASFGVMWGTGALAGAVTAGWAFEGFGPDGYLYLIAILFAFFPVAVIGRQLATRR